MVVALVLNAPGYLSRAWQSLISQADAVTTGVRVGNTLGVLAGAVGSAMLLLPVVGMTLTYLLLCRGVGASLAVRRARATSRSPRRLQRMTPSA